MEDVDIGRLIFLLLIGLMLTSWLIRQSRLSLNKTLQQAAIWGLIFLGAIASYGLWDEISQTVRPQQTVFGNEGKIVVPRNQNGHYYLTAEVNKASVRFVVDTGATEMVLTKKDAAAAGLNPDQLVYIGRAMTANGEVRTAGVRLNEVTIGSITDRDLSAVVNGGEMSESLLGMTYLQRWGKIEISGGELTLTR